MKAGLFGEEAQMPHDQVLVKVRGQIVEVRGQLVKVRGQLVEVRGQLVEVVSSLFTRIPRLPLAPQAGQRTARGGGFLFLSLHGFHSSH